MTDEPEDLDALLGHPGWLRLTAYAKKRWSDEVTTLLRGAVNDTNDAAALQKMRQIIVAKDAVEALLKWPEERLAELARKRETERTTTMSRGGF